MTGSPTQNTARPAAPSEGSPLDPQHLLATIKPELKEVIDAAVARVAEVELTAVQQAQQLVAHSEQEARKAYGSAVAHSSELVGMVEVLAATVSDMSATLRAEIDGLVESLRGIHESLADWPTEADQQQRSRT